MIVENQEYILDDTKRVKIIWKKYDKACILEVGVEYPTAIVDIDRLKGVPLNEDELNKLGFEIVRWKEPNYQIGMDRFYKLDYAVIKLNKNEPLTDNLCIRFGNDNFILDGYYSVRFNYVHEISLLLSILDKTLV